MTDAADSTTRNYHVGLTEDVPDLNLKLLIGVYRDFQADPFSFGYDWRECFAGHAAVKAGGEWLKPATSGYGSSLLKPTGDNDPDAKTWLTNNGTVAVACGDRGQRVLGLTKAEADALFISVDPNRGDDYRTVIEKILQDRQIDPGVLDRK